MGDVPLELSCVNISDINIFIQFISLNINMNTLHAHCFSLVLKNKIQPSVFEISLALLNDS